MKKDKTLIILNKTFKYGFGVVPFQILRNPKIPKHLKTVYTLLLSYAWYGGECFPGQDRLARDLGCSVQSINKDLKDLKAMGLIDWRRRGLGKTNVYYILDIPDELKFEPDLKFSLNQDLKFSSNKIDEGEIDKDLNNGASQKAAPINLNSPLKEEEKRPSGSSIRGGEIKTPADIFREKLGDILKPRRGITKEWQEKAFRFAGYLGITLKDPKLKARWLKFFKDHANSAKLDSAAAYLKDAPGFLACKNDEEKIKYFFWYVYNH